MTLESTGLLGVVLGDAGVSPGVVSRGLTGAECRPAVAGVDESVGDDPRRPVIPELADWLPRIDAGPVQQ